MRVLSKCLTVTRLRGKMEISYIADNAILITHTQAYVIVPIPPNLNTKNTIPLQYYCVLNMGRKDVGHAIENPLFNSSLVSKSEQYILYESVSVCVC